MRTRSFVGARVRRSAQAATFALGMATALAGCRRTTPPTEDRSNGGGMWGANYFPNIPLTTHEGRAVRFFDDLIKDKVVAVNFIYTRCADSCPMETARMLEVQRLLADRLGKDIFFYSISVDPEHDTPEVLRKYAANWGTGPGWTFLTGKDADITLLRQKLGVYEADIKKKDHNLSLIIGNQKTGRWMRRSPAENPYVLATQLGSWLHNWKLPEVGAHDYADAPAVRNISTGEELFRARCAMCHTVGGGDQDDPVTRRVGPDLLNVTRQRDREWLERWIAEPDKMLAAQDPIAVQLFSQYRNVNMPNMRLDKSQVDAVLKYVEEESADVERRAKRAHAAAVAARASASAVGADDAPPTPSAAVALPATASATAVLDRYEALRSRLAADDLAAARREAAALDLAATRLADDAQPARPALVAAATAARDLAGSADDAAARKAFGQVSQQIVAVLVGTPALRAGRFLFRCPMVKGYQKWVQTSDDLKNPYWGARMLTCGSRLESWEI